MVWLMDVTEKCAAQTRMCFGVVGQWRKLITVCNNISLFP